MKNNWSSTFGLVEEFMDLFLISLAVKKEPTNRIKQSLVRNNCMILVDLKWNERKYHQMTQLKPSLEPIRLNNLGTNYTMKTQYKQEEGFPSGFFPFLLDFRCLVTSIFSRSLAVLLWICSRSRKGFRDSWHTSSIF